MLNILTIDLEEWYHPEYVKDKVSRSKEERVIKNLDRILSILRERRVNATFFVVGEILEKHPEVQEKVIENGHEVAFHGYYHKPLWELNEKEFELEIRKFHSLMKERCRGFRAPSFSLNNKTKWGLKVLELARYKYDSSIFPTKTPLYGQFGAPTRPYKPSHQDLAKEDEKTKLWEFPLLTYGVSRLRVPVAGGFYLRTLPVSLIERAIKKMNKHVFPAVVFFHTWELDRETPKLKLGPYRSFVTYHNLEATERKLNCILSGFKFTDFRSFIEKGLPDCLI